jgi:hypothetical protein
MEFVSGSIKLRDIFLDNGNWWRFFLAHRNLIRKAILINVLKMLVCRTSFLGWHVFVCPTCRRSVKAPHSCKSRFCSSCGKKATDHWIQTAFNNLPDTPWQHITWTLPAQLQPFFWANRHLFNTLPPLAAHIIKRLAAQHHFLPGIFLAIHTFGRDLKRNFHVHLSTTAGGLSLDRQQWIPHAYFYHDTLKSMWRYALLSLLRSEFKAGHLKLPRRLRHLKTYTAFNSWLNVLYQKTWVVHLNEQSNNRKATIEYLGKDLKRPPLGESRIPSYNGPSVVFTYLDHYTDTTQTLSLPVLDFLARLIAHIPDRYFRNIRYYGFLAQRLRSQLLPIVYRLLDQFHRSARTLYRTWRDLLKASFGLDPLTCPLCGTQLVFAQLVRSPPQHVLISFHHQIAQGYFKRL